MVTDLTRGGKKDWHAYNQNEINKYWNISIELPNHGPRRSLVSEALKCQNLINIYT